MILNFLNLFISEIRFNGLVGVALRPPPVAEKGSKALSEITSKRWHIYVQRIATIFQTGGHWPPASNSTKYAENVILEMPQMYCHTVAAISDCQSIRV